MDLYVQPSHFEGVPNAVLEAMAVGLPVLATDVGGVPEVVTDGVTGSLVQPNNLHLLQEGICELIQRPKILLDMGRAGRTRVEELFSISAMVNEYEALFERVARNGKSPTVYA